jgi:hypothetical protein
MTTATGTPYAHLVPGGEADRRDLPQPRRHDSGDTAVERQRRATVSGVASFYNMYGPAINPTAGAKPQEETAR